MDRVLVDVDTQHDFMIKTGALYVPGADEILPNLVRLFGYARASKTFVLSSADCHAQDDPEFQQFPPHCVDGTPGQSKLPETLLDRHRIIQPGDSLDEPAKLTEECEQVVFNKATFDVFSNPSAVGLVEAIDVDEYIVFGVATDYCVRADALGLLARGRRVAVVEDAIRAVADETGQAALHEMTSAGARLTTTDQIVGDNQ
jgi:nicotinamidase/pyrazinamidase